MHAYHTHRHPSKIEKKVSRGTHRGPEKCQPLPIVKRSNSQANKQIRNTDKGTDALCGSPRQVRATGSREAGLVLTERLLHGFGASWAFSSNNGSDGRKAQRESQAEGSANLQSELLRGHSENSDTSGGRGGARRGSQV